MGFMDAIRGLFTKKTLTLAELPKAELLNRRFDAEWEVKDASLDIEHKKKQLEAEYDKAAVQSGGAADQVLIANITRLERQIELKSGQVADLADYLMVLDEIVALREEQESGILRPSLAEIDEVKFTEIVKEWAKGKDKSRDRLRRMLGILDERRMEAKGRMPAKQAEVADRIARMRELRAEGKTQEAEKVKQEGIRRAASGSKEAAEG